MDTVVELIVVITNRSLATAKHIRHFTVQRQFFIKGRNKFANLKGPKAQIHENVSRRMLPEQLYSCFLHVMVRWFMSPTTYNKYTNL